MNMLHFVKIPSFVLHIWTFNKSFFNLLSVSDSNTLSKITNPFYKKIESIIHLIIIWYIHNY